MVAIGIGAVLGIRVSFRSTPVTAPGTPADVAQATELLEVTLDGDAIPQDLAGILFFRKVYPTDQEIAYGRGFVPPNTFVRYVESGELAIRPRSDVQVIRAGTTWAEAEIVGAGEEAVVGPGDTFVMQDIPFDAYGSEALGTMSDTRRRRPRRRLRHPRVEPLLFDDATPGCSRPGITRCSRGSRSCAGRRSRCASPAGTCPPAPTCRRSTMVRSRSALSTLGTISGIDRARWSGGHGCRATDADLRRRRHHRAPQHAARMATRCACPTMGRRPRSSTS